MEWETIDNFHTRTKVFGGWLVKAYEHVEHATYAEDNAYWAREQSQEMNISMAFVPDINHEWEIGDAFSNSKQKDILDVGLHVMPSEKDDGFNIYRNDNKVGYVDDIALEVPKVYEFIIKEVVE